MELKTTIEITVRGAVAQDADGLWYAHVIETTIDGREETLRMGIGFADRSQAQLQAGIRAQRHADHLRQWYSNSLEAIQRRLDKLTDSNSQETV